MPITFQCECGKKMRAQDSLAGKRTRCPNCSTVLTIPAAETSADAPAPPSPSPIEPDFDPETPYGLEPVAGTPYSLASNPGADSDPDLRALRTVKDDDRPVSRGRARGGSEPSTAAAAATAGGKSPFEYLYLLLALALIPLALTLLAKDEGSFKERLERTMENASPEVVARIQNLVATRENGDPDDFVENLIDALPGGRLTGAHLARRTITHWIYAAVASIAFWVLFMFLFPAEKKNPAHVFMIGLFTGTIGIVLLLFAQFLAGATQGFYLSRGSLPILLIFYIAKFIGFSYASANDPDSNLWLSFIGFTCGVGLCEELAKALPVLAHFRKYPTLGWRGACLWGLASGVGFGVSEGIMYSANYYNGISPVGIYVVRYVSCVVLHAIWSASIGITIWRRQSTIQGDTEWSDYALAVLQMLAVPMVLHGLYDTLLKKDMEIYALLIGGVSFAWFVWQVESARGTDTESSLRRLQRA